MSECCKYCGQPWDGHGTACQVMSDEIKGVDPIPGSPWKPTSYTPETDAYLRKYCLDDSTDLCLLDLARKLERERDELRLKLAQANLDICEIRRQYRQEANEFEAEPAENKPAPSKSPGRS